LSIEAAAEGVEGILFWPWRMMGGNWLLMGGHLTIWKEKMGAVGNLAVI